MRSLRWRHRAGVVVIEANGVIDVDYTGSQILQQAIVDLHRRKIDVAMARLESERAAEAAARTGLLGVLGTGRVFRSVDEAINSSISKAVP